MTTAELNKQLDDMILAGKALEAFEKFYADDVVMCENFDKEKEWAGKAVNLKREQEFFGSIAEFHGGSVGKTASEGDVSFSEWFMECTFKNGMRVKMNQVAVRQWKNGKIVHERFYYKGA